MVLLPEHGDDFLTVWILPSNSGFDRHWILIAHMLFFELYISLLEMEHLLLESFYLQRRALLDLLQSVFEVMDCGLVLLLLSQE